VNAVLRIDLELRRLALLVLDVLVDLGGAEALLGRGVCLPGDLLRNILQIFLNLNGSKMEGTYAQVRWLIVVVVGATAGQICQ
jgi:hypothetical protein